MCSELDNLQNQKDRNWINSISKYTNFTDKNINKPNPIFKLNIIRHTEVGKGLINQLSAILWPQFGNSLLKVHTSLIATNS